MLAAALSTYNSIGSSLSALLTRDVYARIFVRDRSDHHYLRVGQFFTPFIILGSFAYVPFMEAGLLAFYVDITSTFVILLLTLFLMWVLTPVHRRSGLIGLLAGVFYGIVRLLAPTLAESHGVVILPADMINSWAAYPISMLITAATMVIVSLFSGWESLAVQQGAEHREQSPWLRESQQNVQDIDRFHGTGQKNTQSDRMPKILALAMFLVGCILRFIVFW